MSLSPERRRASHDKGSYAYWMANADLLAKQKAPQWMIDASVNYARKIYEAGL